MHDELARLLIAVGALVGGIFVAKMLRKSKRPTV